MTIVRISRRLDLSQLDLQFALSLRCRPSTCAPGWQASSALANLSSKMHTHCIVSRFHHSSNTIHVCTRRPASRQTIARWLLPGCLTLNHQATGASSMINSCCLAQTDGADDTSMSVSDLRAPYKPTRAYIIYH